MVDTTAHDDAEVTSIFNNTVGNTDLFKTDSTYKNVGCMELNQFVLDGSFDTTPNSYTVPFWSIRKSEADCTFINNPSLLVTFDDAHTSSGITLSFLGDYPVEILVSWYYDSEYQVKIDTKRFYPNSTNFFCNNQVENYKAVKIEFVKTRLPKQYVKGTFILYGQILTWSNTDVISATVNEETDVTSATIPINTAELTLIDEDNQFNVQNADGIWKSLQGTQRVVITEDINGTEIDVGTFYIDKWESKENAITITAFDSVGLIDRAKFMGGMYTDAPVGILIQQIMASADYSDYEIDEELAEITLSGYLPIMSCREALQQIAFAIGAVVDCSRGSAIRVYVPDRNVDSYILKDRKFSGTAVVTLDEYISGVSVTCSKYNPLDEYTEVFSGELEKGIHRIEFSEPYQALNCEGADIVESSVNYAVIDVADNGEVAINGMGYEKTEYTVSKDVTAIEVGQVAKVKAFSGLTLYNMQILSKVVAQLLSWYSLRQKMTIEYICESEKVGEWVGVQDSIKASMFAITRINSQKIDLTGGYLATADCRGYSSIVSTYAYMGNNEMIMNGEELI